MAREIAWPFHIGPTGGIATVEDSIIQTFQHITQILLTRPGERTMHPDYGSPIHDYLFETNDDVVAAELGLRLQDAIRRWEPGVIVHSITPTSSPEEGTLMVEIAFSVPGQTEVFTTVVGVGGNFLEEVST